MAIPYLFGIAEFNGRGQAIYAWLIIMDKIIEIIQQFKKPLIIAGVFIAVFFVLTSVVPMLKEANANKTPIVEIVAENDKEYQNTEELLAEDFSITAIHENGAKTALDSSMVELSRTTLSPVGDTTTVTLTYIEDSSIYCNIDVKVAREKIMGFQCGYPDVTNVIAVLYSNGELCFEGKGDTLTFDEGNYPWIEYEGQDECPIKSVTFEDTVTPRVMDYWFEGVETLTYIDQIPVSVQSMKRTFFGCINLDTMADWTKCEILLDVTECYSGCSSLKYTVAFPEHVTKASSAFLDCVLLQKTPNLSNASSLKQCSGMFSGCLKLVSITMPPKVVDISSMFQRCINLQIMPSIPDSVTNMSNAFAECTALKTLSAIPANVANMDNCFSSCEFITGTLAINANPENLNGVFSNACVATSLDLNGASLILDAFANTAESGNITVNGNKPIPEITSLETYYSYKEELDEQRQEEANP